MYDFKPTMKATYLCIYLGGKTMFSSYLLNIITFLPQAAKEQTQDLIVKTNKLQGEK